MTKGIPLDLHGLLSIILVANLVLSASANAQDHIDVIHPGTLHLLCILMALAVSADPASQEGTPCTEELQDASNRRAYGQWTATW